MSSDSKPSEVMPAAACKRQRYCMMTKCSLAAILCCHRNLVLTEHMLHRSRELLTPKAFSICSRQHGSPQVTLRPP